MRMLLCGIVLVLLMVVCSTVYGGEFTVEGCLDYEFAEVDVMWWPDPNGGVGLLLLADSEIQGSQEPAVGAVVQFSTGPIYDAVIDTIIPGAWNPMEDVPVEPFAKIGVAWDLDDEYLVSIFGTGMKLFPGRRIQPVIWSEYILPEGNAPVEEDLRLMVGAVIRFGE